MTLITSVEFMIDGRCSCWVSTEAPQKQTKHAASQAGVSLLLRPGWVDNTAVFATTLWTGLWEESRRGSAALQEQSGSDGRWRDGAGNTPTPWSIAAWQSTRLWCTSPTTHTHAHTPPFTHQTSLSLSCDPAQIRIIKLCFIWKVLHLYWCWWL